MLMCKLDNDVSIVDRLVLPSTSLSIMRSFCNPLLRSRDIYPSFSDLMALLDLVWMATKSEPFQYCNVSLRRKCHC